MKSDPKSASIPGRQLVDTLNLVSSGLTSYWAKEETVLQFIKTELLKDANSD